MLEQEPSCFTIRYLFMFGRSLEFSVLKISINGGIGIDVQKAINVFSFIGFTDCVISHLCECFNIAPNVADN